MKQKLILAISSLIGPLLIKFVGMTWRVKWDGLDNLASARQGDGRVLFCSWHSRLLGLCYAHRHRNIGIMVSKSFDGEWITRIVTRLGYRTFRGSASRNGAAALVEMLHGKDQGDLALTVDGPRGPAQKVKPGAITLASRASLPIVPISYVASSAWLLKTWDRFILPKPFSIITVRYGLPIVIARNSESLDFGKYASQIEEGINRIG